MADVTDRGQLLLTGAFVLAVAVIGLSLLFSAGTYTTALATESGPMYTGGDAISVRESVEADLRWYFADLNTRGISYSNKQSRFGAVVDDLDSQLADRYARRGRIVSVSVPSPPSYEEGVRVKQTPRATGGFATFDRPTDRGTPGSVAWDVIGGGRIRNMTFAIHDVPLSGDPPMRLALRSNTGPKAWDIEVTSGWNVRVVNVQTGTTLGTCAGTSPKMIFNVTAATVEGDHCSALEAVHMDSTDYRLRIENGENARGQFWFITDQTGPTGTLSAQIGTGTTTTDSDILYEAGVTYRYHTATVDYVTEIRLAPEEIR